MFLVETADPSILRLSKEAPSSYENDMTRLIKKYKNRRLYDTEKSQYITVEELQNYVLKGVLFRVEDVASGKDITNVTLLQIFVEMESGSYQFLSAEMLRQLIVLAHHPMNQGFKQTLEQLFTTMEKSVQANPYLKDCQKTAAVWQKEMQNIIEQWQELFKR